MNLISTISQDECVGNSLLKINDNFLALNDFAFFTPVILEHHGIHVEEIISERNQFIQKINTQNSIVHQKTFSSTTSNVLTADYFFNDGTSINTYKFDYVPLGQPKPVGYFESVSLEDNSPLVTLYWLASASNVNTTLFATNSAFSQNLYQRGKVWPNDIVTALYQDNNTLYIGGEFTEIEGTTRKKLAAISLSGGNIVSPYGPVGTLLGDPLSAGGGSLEDFGTVTTIQKINILGESLLIVGGSFNSTTRGRGLTVQSLNSGLARQFYINGRVIDSLIVGDNLYIVGDFDYINYSSVPLTAPVVKTNGIAKINLTNLITSPNFCIDINFAENTSNLFFGPAIIHSIACKTNSLYIGGRFKILENHKLVAQHLAAIDSKGLRLNTWSPILNGAVYELFTDNCLPINTLYVGGDFTTFYNLADFNTPPRLTPVVPELKHSFSYAMAFSLAQHQSPKVLEYWKPRFNAPVTTIRAHDRNPQSQVYVAGQFTKVNNTDVSYVAAIQKATNFFFNQGVDLQWNVYLQGAPPIESNSLIRLQSPWDSVAIGGTFTQINDHRRYYYARVSGYQETIGSLLLSSVNFELGGQIVSNGTSFAMQLSTTPAVRAIASVRPYQSIIATQFPVIIEGFKGLTKNQLCRFFIKRPGHVNLSTLVDLPSCKDTFRDPVYLVGWSIDYSKTFSK
jgi:hypothetical protein